MSLYDSWLNERLGRAKELPGRIQAMHLRYGSTDNQECRHCRHFLRYRQSITWFKCELHQPRKGRSNDWKATWPACGKFEHS